LLIKAAVAKDLGFIQRCAREAYNKYVERIGKPPAPMVADFASAIRASHVSLVQSDGELAGYVVCYPVGSEMHLENIAVLPSFCGKGLGRALVLHVETQATTQAIDAVFLYTNEAMTENLSWYPSLGYQEYKRITEAGFKRVYFRKKL